MPLSVAWIAFAATVVAHNFGAEGPAAGVTSHLPSGTSDAFRARMIEWRGATEPSSLHARNEPEAQRQALLSRLSISSGFGWRTDPITGVERHHAGIDLPGRYGSPVLATSAGTVRLARWQGGYGNMIEIEHDGGVRTRYGHLSRVEVHPSQHVEQGQVIGEVGSTGHSTGPHLHFEIRVAGSAVDPLTFTGQAAPSFGTVWGADFRATTKWEWSTDDAGNSLPEASLR